MVAAAGKQDAVLQTPDGDRDAVGLADVGFVGGDDGARHVLVGEAAGDL